MKKLLLLLALGGFAVAGHAQEILVGADFKMYFDNKEFGSNEFAVPGLDIESGTDFADTQWMTPFTRRPSLDEPPPDIGS